MSKWLLIAVETTLVQKEYISKSLSKLEVSKAQCGVHTCFSPCYRSAQLQSPSPLYVCRADGTRGARGIAPPDFGSIRSNLFHEKSLYYCLPHPDFQTFRRPCMWGKKHQFMAKAGSPFEQGSNLWFWQKKRMYLQTYIKCYIHLIIMWTCGLSHKSKDFFSIFLYKF